jgi:hypothetical protein
MVASLDAFRDIGRPSRFRHYWPDLDTDRWPGREAYWAWRHPVIFAVIIFAFLNVVLGILGYPVVAV